MDEDFNMMTRVAVKGRVDAGVFVGLVVLEGGDKCGNIGKCFVE